MTVQNAGSRVPSGRSPGTRRTGTLVVKGLSEDDAVAVIRATIDKDTDADARTIRICIDRDDPRREDGTPAAELLSLPTVGDALGALRGVLAAASYRTLTPPEARAVANVVSYCARRLQAAVLKEGLNVQPQS
jgi:hypothetical protein